MSVKLKLMYLSEMRTEGKVCKFNDLYSYERVSNKVQKTNKQTKGGYHDND